MLDYNQSSTIQENKSSNHFWKLYEMVYVYDADTFGTVSLISFYKFNFHEIIRVWIKYFPEYCKSNTKSLIIHFVYEPLRMELFIMSNIYFLQIIEE
jgi:hypothetical protein